MLRKTHTTQAESIGPCTWDRFLAGLGPAFRSTPESPLTQRRNRPAKSDR